MDLEMHIRLASPADFAGADDIITNLAKGREPGIEITEPSQSLIFDYYRFKSQDTQT